MAISSLVDDNSISKKRFRLKYRFKPVLFVFAVLILVTAVFVTRGNPFAQNDVNKLAEDLSLNFGQGIEDETDPYLAFFFEIYSLVKNEYWNVVDEALLGNIVKLSIEKINEITIDTIPTTRAEVKTLLVSSMEGKSDEEKKEFITQVGDMLLANLEPFGRSRLYSVKQQQDLSNTVLNIDPNKNQYEELGIGEDATQDDVEAAYEEKKLALENKEQTPETKKQLEELDRAYAALGDEKNREIYDEHKIEPTLTNKLISPRIFYVKVEKFSPNTVQELDHVMSKVDSGTELDTLILDLRGNIGGAIDGLPYFLGPFIGPDQYAYQFFRRGEKKDFKTVTTWLPSMLRYKKVVVLIDGNAQSSAEVFASVLKKYNVGILVGEKTRGWGTVEKVYPLQHQITDSETYSAFLVHSVTLREDGQPIEGRGVDPHVDITTDNWKQELYSYFNYQELVNAVADLVH